MLGFYSAWPWDKVEEFMINEKLVPAGYTQEQWDRQISKAVRDMNPQRNPKGQMCIVYLLAEAKSLRT